MPIHTWLVAPHVAAHFICVSQMILKSNIMTSDMQHTYLTSFVSIMKSPWIGEKPCFVAYTSYGITKQDALIYPCPSTYKRLLLNSNIPTQFTHNTPPTNTPPLFILTKAPCPLMLLQPSHAITNQKCQRNCWNTLILFPGS